MGLFTPAWNGKNLERALAAVDALTDQAELVRAVSKARFFAVRDRALDKLITPEALAEVVQKGDWYYHGEKALNRIHDRDVLFGIARNARRDEARLIAIEKLMDHTLEDDDLTHLIHFCGDKLKCGQDKNRRIAAKLLLTMYKKYRREEIRAYNGVFVTKEGTGKHSDSGHTDVQECHFHICTGHTDSHDDHEIYRDVLFTTEESE